MSFTLEDINNELLHKTPHTDHPSSAGNGIPLV